MVWDSRPVLSHNNLAALPVGAAHWGLTPFAYNMCRIEPLIVVLPTPGPPVITRTFDDSASRIASRCPGARVTPNCASTHGSAFTGQSGATAEFQLAAAG